MNIQNRRLKEIQRELVGYRQLLSESETISDCLIYQGKIESLEREEKEILRRYDINV